MDVCSICACTGSIDDLKATLAERDAEILDMVRRHEAYKTAAEGRLDLATSARDRYRIEAERLADELRDCRYEVSIITIRQG